MVKLRFGHGMLQLFGLNSEYINLNGGSFGTPPQAVLERCSTLNLNAEIESNPDRFVHLLFSRRVDECRGRLAEFLAVPRSEIVLVPNVTTGMNIILKNIRWKEGDVIIMLDTTFPTVSANVRSLTEPRVELISLKFPISHAEILTVFRTALRTVKANCVDGARLVALFDSIVSMPGVLLPWKQMVRICQEENVLSIVDAAHSLGQERHIDLGNIQPDFWISNCSKWAYARRGATVLYVPRRNRHMIRENVPPAFKFPPAQDEEYPDFAPWFYWTGSGDLSSFLSAPFGLDFRSSIGSETEIIEYCHDLAVADGRAVAKILKTQVMDSSENPGELIVNMVNIELLLPGRIQKTERIMSLFDVEMLEKHKLYASLFYHNAKWWVRASAQIFNEVSGPSRIQQTTINST
ncbi:PLP-dependent transferase [Mycena epipterygia]|nr:PLP-dependent transferase [Mycena epipterygia]